MDGWDEFEAELRDMLRTGDLDAARRTAGHGGARVRSGETKVLLAMCEHGFSGDILALSAAVSAHYERLLEDARGRRIAELGVGVWRELVAADKALAVDSFLQWRDLPGAFMAVETTVLNDGQQVITRLMSVATARADDVPDWFDISDLMQVS